MKTSAHNRPHEAGFTLVETLAALLLTGLVLSALATITAQWLPNWNRGIDRVQRSEALAIALQRITADLGAAAYVPPNREQRRPLFDGSELAVIFVRTALGPNAGPGLDVVRIAEATDRQGFVTVRSRAAFGPLPIGASLVDQVQFRDPVVLLHAPFRLSFAYADRDRAWKSSWHDAKRLPTAIKLTVRDAATERELAVSTIVAIHAEGPAAEAADKQGGAGSAGAEENAANDGKTGTAMTRQGGT
jgi:general secretion pathway protein J